LFDDMTNPGFGREAPSLYTRLPFFYGWVIVWVMFMQAFASAGVLWATGVLSVPMHDELGWSRSVIFAGITVRTLGAAFGGIVLGKYVDTPGGARLLALGGNIVAALGLFLVVFIQEPWQFLLVFGVLGGLFGAGPSSLLMGAVVPKWFIRQRARAVATSTMGTGLAAFLLPAAITFLSDAYGWRSAWLGLGVLTAVLGILPSLLIRTQPEDIGLYPDGDASPTAPIGRPGTASASALRGQSEFSFRPREAFRTTTLWLLIVAAVFGSVSPTAFPTNLVPAYVERGFSASTAAVAFSAYGLISFSGRFFWGYLADRLHIRKILLIISTYCGVTVPLLFLLPGDTALIAGAIAGLGIGGWVGLNQVIWAAYFGRANLGAINGVIRPFITVSSATGPLYVAALADIFDSYAVSIGVMALSWWLCALFLFVVRPARLPERANAPVAQPVG
jgi:MFS family permease